MLPSTDRMIPPEVICLIVEASFDHCLPYQEQWEVNTQTYFSLSRISSLFRLYAREHLSRSISVKESNVQVLNCLRMGGKDSLMQKIKLLSVEYRVPNILLQLFQEVSGLEVLWIDCSGVGSRGDLSLVEEFPKSIHTLHLHSDTRTRWIDVPSQFTILVSSLSISTTFISPLSHSLSPNLTTLSILVEFSCNIAPDSLVELFERIGPQLLKLQILKYGPEILPGFPTPCFRHLSSLQHFSISGSTIIPEFLYEIPSKLISLRYINSYSEYLPQTFLELPTCLTKLKRLGFPVQVEKMRGKEGLEEWAKERKVELVELELSNGKWQEDLDLLDW